MPFNPQRMYETLRAKLQPSFDIQRMGSSQPSLRNSTTFGPQMSVANWRKIRGKQAGNTIKNQLGDMNR